MHSTSPVVVPGPLAPFAAGFDAELARLGYTPDSAYGQLRLAAELSAWSGLCDEPITAPYKARHTTLAASMARILGARPWPSRISSKKRCRARRMASITARPRQAVGRAPGGSSVVVTGFLSVGEYDEPWPSAVTGLSVRGQARLAPRT